MARLIDADKLVAELQKKPIHDGHFIHTRDVSDAIFNAPTISPDEVRGVGEWIITTDRFAPELTCSNCNATFPAISDCCLDAKINYCPNCGSKMEVSEDA